MGEEDIVYVHPNRLKNGEERRECVKNGVVCKIRAPRPPEWKSAGGKRSCFSRRAQCENKSAADKWGDIDRPEAVLQVQLGEVKSGKLGGGK